MKKVFKKVFKGCEVVFKTEKQDVAFPKLVGIAHDRHLDFENRWCKDDDEEITVYLSTRAWGIDLFIRDYLHELEANNTLVSVSFGTMQEGPGGFSWHPAINQRGGH